MGRVQGVEQLQTTQSQRHTYGRGCVDQFMMLEVKRPEAKQGFVLLTRRWVAERSLGWLACFRRLSRDARSVCLHY